jgi:hypothetical protein
MERHETGLAVLCEVAHAASREANKAEEIFIEENRV